MPDDPRHDPEVAADDEPLDVAADDASADGNADPTADGTADPADGGPPRLEVAAVAALVGSVVLAVVPPTEPVAPVAWVAGMVMVLLSRRWGAGDKGVALVAFGILGVPFVALGRDELRAPVSVVTGVALVALWVGASAWLLRRSRVAREEVRGLRMR